MIQIVFVRDRNNYYSIVPLLAAVSAMEGLCAEVADMGAIIAGHQPVAGTAAVIYAFSFNSIDFAGDQEAVTRLVKKLKEEHAAVLICGGPHPTARPEEMLALGMDAVVTGGGETALRRIVKLVQEGQRPAGTYQGSIENLDDWPPFPERSGHYKPIEITRGCPHGCAFCQTSFLFSRKQTHRSLENILHYVGKARERNFRDFRFISPNALCYGESGSGSRHDKVKELLYRTRQRIGSEGRIFFGTFPSEVRPEFVSRDIIRFMKGVVDNRRILIGAQTGSDRMMKLSRRGHSVRHVDRAIEICIEEGFGVDVDLIFGMPFEDDGDLRATLDFIGRYREEDVSFNLHYFMPLPGTPWQDERPVPLSGTVMRDLDSMVGRGKAWGNWKRQMKTCRTPDKKTLKKNSG